MPVIHFSTLVDFLAEYADAQPDPAAPIIRVSIQQRVKSHNGVGGSKTYTFNVFVQAIHEGQILSYVAYEQHLDIDVLSDKAKVRSDYDLYWRQVNAIKSEIGSHLRYEGYAVRNGIIDMGTVQPIPGERWPLAQPVA